MKKLLFLTRPLSISVLSLLIVSAFLRYYLAINSDQLLREFKNQNFREIYSMDTLKLASRMNALSSVINWVCIEGSVDNRSFYKMERGTCNTGLIQHKKELHVPEANNIRIIFTVRLPKEVEQLFILFLVLQSLLIAALVQATRKTEEEKRENEIRVNRLARQMSHDIRSPLATLNTVLGHVKSVSNDEMILVHKSLERINSIADSLLKGSKKETNSPLADLPLFDIKKAINEIVEEKKLEFSTHDEVQINFTPVAPGAHTAFAKINLNEFKRIISNLLNNAYDARFNSVVITVAMSVHQNNVEIRIIDNGKGIPEAILQKLGKGEITSKASGNGLGVQHAFEKIKSWGGTIDIKSEVNLGTEIVIKLPAEVQEVQPTKAILIDDDELVKLTWKSVARKHNIELETYSRLQDFETSLATLPPETFFYIDSDLGDGQKGETIARELKTRGFQNIFMATGYTDENFKDLPFLKGVLSKTPPWK